MSRFSGMEADDLEGMLAAARWRAQVESVVRGKRGRGQICEMAHALLAMPQRRLVHGQIVSQEGDVCFVGAYAAYQRTLREHKSWERITREMRQEFMIPDGRYRAGEFFGDDASYTEDLGVEEGLAVQLAGEAAWLNDEIWGEYYLPEERWQLALAWCWQKLAFPRKYAAPKCKKVRHK